LSVAGLTSRLTAQPGSDLRMASHWPAGKRETANRISLFGKVFRQFRSIIPYTAS